MLNVELWDTIISRISKAFSILEISEKKAVVRALRILYFYPDELLRQLNILIDTNAADPETAILESEPYLNRVEEYDQELTFITSDSVATNLQLSIEMVEELRRLADFKSGVRSTLHAIFFAYVIPTDGSASKIVCLAKRAREEIEHINASIRSLEKAILTGRNLARPAP